MDSRKGAKTKNAYVTKVPDRAGRRARDLRHPHVQGLDGRDGSHRGDHGCDSDKKGREHGGLHRGR
jgi:hypothetical protein